jgi:hypothetical protein
MVWLKERLALLGDAYTHRKGLITAAIAACAFVGAFDPVTNWFKSAIKAFVSPPPWAPASSKEGVMVFGIPSWQVGGVLLLVVFIIVLFEYALRLQRQLAPKIAVDFIPDGDGIVQTPIQIIEFSVCPKMS